MKHTLIDINNENDFVQTMKIIIIDIFDFRQHSKNK